MIFYYFASRGLVEFITREQSENVAAQINTGVESSGQREGEREGDAIKFPRLELNHFALALFVPSEIYCTALVGKIKK